MSIGPSLPPHLQRLKDQQTAEEESDESSGGDDFGPRLPAVACRGPRPPTPSEPGHIYFGDSHYFILKFIKEKILKLAVFHGR